jgi:predicted RecA/RadA family phage recombinase
MNSPTSSERASSRTGVSGRPKNPARLGLAVLLVLGGGLVFLGLYRARGQQVPVLIVARDVPAGQPLTDKDVAIAEVAATGVEVVPAKDLPLLNGKVARVALSKGALLAPQQIGAGSPLPADEALVALAFPDVAVPRALHNEDKVRLIVGDAMVDATVTDIKAVTTTSGTMSITFQLKQADAKSIATGKDVRLLVLPSGADVATEVIAAVPSTAAPSVDVNVVAPAVPVALVTK